MNNNILYIDVDKAVAELCKRSLSYFVKEFWSTVVSDPLVWNWHMDVLCDELQLVYERIIGTLEKNEHGEMVRKRLPKLHDLVINIPPGTSKSTICTIMAPAWSWIVDPSLRHITGSYSDSLSTEHSVKSRDIIESDKYLKLFPSVEIKKDKGQKTNYETTKLGQRYATSVGGSVTGVHAHIITIDDPLNPKEAASVVSLKTANDWNDKTLSMRKVDKEVTVTIIVMQRLATNDVTGHILSKKKDNVRHICLPAEDSINVKPIELRAKYTGGLLDANRLSFKVLAEARINLGGDGYAGQMAQTPVQEGGLIWKKWFKIVPDNIFPSKKMLSQYGTDWDMAYTKEEENAASAYITAGKLKNDIYIDDLDFQWLEFPELVRWVKSKPSPHYIEAKASGKSVKQVLVKNGIIAIEVQVSGGDKIARAKMATPIAEAGFCYIRESLADKMYNDEKQGILMFPRGQFKDLADTLAQCLQRLGIKTVNTIVSEPEYDILDDLFP